MDRGGVVQDFIHSLEQLSNPVMLFKVKCITIFPSFFPMLCLGKKVQGGDATAAGSGSPCKTGTDARVLYGLFLMLLPIPSAS